MSACGLELTLAAVRAHLACMLWPRYELRLIDAQRRRCLATRHWSATQLLDPGVVRFLRAYNREGCDVYFRPYAASENAGYVLLDFDDGPCPLAAMGADGHTPCVVVSTSPGHQQAWVHVSAGCVPASWATAVARWLAKLYKADPASAEWRHLGRLAGFTNRKPARLQPNGMPPWVRLAWRQSGGALADISSAVVPAAPVPAGIATLIGVEPSRCWVYRECLDALELQRRFPAPDWSIADYWVARLLLQQRWDAGLVIDILRNGSPGFPRRHAKPDDYLRRTVQAAAESLIASRDFSARRCGSDAGNGE